MRRRLAALACLAPTLLAGCIDLAPAYHRPPTPSPATFPSGPAYAPQVGPAQAAVGWRDFFADPKLRTVIEQALANNRDLRVAMANVVVARAQYHVQRAYLFPTITANAQATYIHEPSSVVGGGAFAGAAPGRPRVRPPFNEKLFSLTARLATMRLTCSVRVDNLNIGAARAAFFPSIELTGDGGLTSLALSALFRGSSATWTFVPTISQTLFDAGANKGNLEVAKAQRQIGAATYEKTIQTAFREVAGRARRARHHRRPTGRAAVAGRRLGDQLPHLPGPLPARQRHLPERADRPADLLFRRAHPGHHPTPPSRPTP